MRRETRNIAVVPAPPVPGRSGSPSQSPGGDRAAQCLDPQGAAFALYCAPRG